MKATTILSFAGGARGRRGEELVGAGHRARHRRTADKRAAAWARIENSSVLTLNEKRAALGFAPLAGADVLLVPGSVAPFGKEGAFRPPSAPGPATAAEDAVADATMDADIGRTPKFRPDQLRIPAGRPGGGRWAPENGADEAEVTPAQELLLGRLPPWIADLFRNGTIGEEELEVPKEAIPRLSGKEAADDPPSWARGEKPMIKESGKDFAKRLMDEKYGPATMTKVQIPSSTRQGSGVIVTFGSRSGSRINSEPRSVSHACGVYSLPEYERAPGVDESKLIGIYTTREKAEAALARVRDKPGFREYPDGFEISERTLDRDNWTEGFVSRVGDKVIES